MSKILVSLTVVALAIFFGWFFYAPADVSELELQVIRGKRVLITGASSGIGEQLAYAYSRLGAVVLLTARRENLLKDVASKCRELGAERVEYVAADMAVAKDRQTLVAQVQKRLQKQLDHLILNHAIYGAGPFVGSEQNMTTLERDLQINFVSLVDIATRCQQMLLASKDGGHVGIVSSGAGKFASPMLSSYSAQKFALQGFFSSWRQELKARGTPISITIFVLGYIKTEAADKVIEEHLPKMSALNVDAPSAEETALAMLKGLIRGAYEFSYPTAMTVFLTAYKFVPGYLEDLLGSYVI